MNFSARKKGQTKFPESFHCEKEFLVGLANVCKKQRKLSTDFKVGVIKKVLKIRFCGIDLMCAPLWQDYCVKITQDDDNSGM